MYNNFTVVVFVSVLCVFDPRRAGRFAGTDWGDCAVNEEFLHWQRHLLKLVPRLRTPVRAAHDFDVTALAHY